MPNDRLSKGSRANAAVGLLLTMLAGGAQGQTSEWLQLRGDRHMSGRASGVGQMHHEPPQERWRYDIAAWEGYVEVAQREGRGAVELPFAAPVDPGYIGTHGRDWGIGPTDFRTSAASRWLCRWTMSSKWPQVLPRGGELTAL